MLWAIRNGLLCDRKSACSWDHSNFNPWVRKVIWASLTAIIFDERMQLPIEKVNASLLPFEPAIDSLETVATKLIPVRLISWGDHYDRVVGGLLASSRLV